MRVHIAAMFCFIVSANSLLKPAINNTMGIPVRRQLHQINYIYEGDERVAVRKALVGFGKVLNKQSTYDELLNYIGKEIDEFNGLDSLLNLRERIIEKVRKTVHSMTQKQQERIYKYLPIEWIIAIVDTMEGKEKNDALYFLETEYRIPKEISQKDRTLLQNFLYKKSEEIRIAKLSDAVTQEPSHRLNRTKMVAALSQ